jgi:hypothetical protein
VAAEVVQAGREGQRRPGVAGGLGHGQAVLEQFTGQAGGQRRPFQLVDARPPGRKGAAQVVDARRVVAVPERRGR